MTHPLRIVELFCGIGGFAAALGGRGELVAAVDINAQALSVYRTNFPHPTRQLTIESIPGQQFDDWAADLIWLSPPCQPYTRKGSRDDLNDPRSEALLNVIEQLARIRPRYLALENVPGFVASQAHRVLRHTLVAAGYRVIERLLCPTALGIPSRRLRFYLLASRDEPLAWRDAPPEEQQLDELLDRDLSESLFLSPAFVTRYRDALHIVDPRRRDQETSCFTAAYGRSPTRSGSYVRTEAGLRRFSPTEIARLLGFPGAFHFPEEIDRAWAWQLLGNSLSVIAVRQILNAIPDLSRHHRHRVGALPAPTERSPFSQIGVSP